MLEGHLCSTRAELVEAEDMRRVVATVLDRFKEHFDAQPAAIVDRLSLPADTSEPIQAMFDELLETANRTPGDYSDRSISLQLKPDRTAREMSDKRVIAAFLNPSSRDAMYSYVRRGKAAHSTSPSFALIARSRYLR